MGAFVGVVIGALGATLLRSDGLFQSGRTVLEEAETACDLELTKMAQMGDEGGSLHLDHWGEEDTQGLDFAEIDCVMTEIDSPDHVMQGISTTRAMDGRQSAEWDGISASWSYHPDTGLDIQLVLD